MTKAANLAASANATVGNVTATALQSNAASTPTLFKDSAGTEVGTLCRAWVNFNGTTSPGTIRAQFNVSSVTRNGTGDYTVNFTNALSDANYAAQGTLNDDAAIIRLNVYSTTSVRLTCIGTGFTALNASIISVSVFR